MVRENIEELEEELFKICNRLGRKRDDIDLIAVTKTIELEKIKEAIDCGYRHLGENRVQALEERFIELEEEKPIFHMIGHLQSNKVKDIIGRVRLIHSVDRMSVVKEIDKRSKDQNIVSDVLLQINISEEETKSGLKVPEVLPFIEKVLSYENMRIKGLMTIAPHTDNEDTVRGVFRKLSKIKEDIQGRNYENISMDYLSMGMTNDYKIALEEGSNIIRLGRLIFGERNY